MLNGLAWLVATIQSREDGEHFHRCLKVLVGQAAPDPSRPHYFFFLNIPGRSNQLWFTPWNSCNYLLWPLSRVYRILHCISGKYAGSWFSDKLQASGGAGSEFGGDVSRLQGACPTQPSTPSHSALQTDRPSPNRCLGRNEWGKKTNGWTTNLLRYGPRWECNSILHVLGAIWRRRFCLLWINLYHNSWAIN